MTETRRPRILIVTRNLPPLVGGMERLNWHMAEELAKFGEVRIVGPEGSAALAPAGIDVREAPLKPLWKFLLRAHSLARREAKQWKPDMVLAGSGLTAPLALHAARACGAKVAVYVHGLDVAIKHPIYRALWLPVIRNVDRVIANSRATALLCKEIGVDPARMGIVHPGVEWPVSMEHSTQRGNRSGDSCARVATELGQSLVSSLPTPRSGDPGCSVEDESVRKVREFRAHHDLGGGPLLLSVGRLSARKGLHEFVTHALPRVIAACPNVMLLIVGDAPSQALHADAQTPAAIHAAAEATGIGERVRFVGKIPDSELESAFRASSVHVFPIREIPGDPEGFGMVAVEAAAHGLPTIAFAAGGVVDAVAEGRSGHLVRPGDYLGFADAVIAILTQRETLRAPCLEFASAFVWPEFGAQVVRQLGLA